MSISDQSDTTDTAVEAESYEYSPDADQITANRRTMMKIMGASAAAIGGGASMTGSVAADEFTTAERIALGSGSPGIVYYMAAHKLTESLEDAIDDWRTQDYDADPDQLHTSLYSDAVQLADRRDQWLIEDDRYADQTLQLATTGIKVAVIRALNNEKTQADAVEKAKEEEINGVFSTLQKSFLSTHQRESIAFSESLQDIIMLSDELNPGDVYKTSEFDAYDLGKNIREIELWNGDKMEVWDAFVYNSDASKSAMVTGFPHQEGDGYDGKTIEEWNTSDLYAKEPPESTQGDELYLNPSKVSKTLDHIEDLRQEAIDLAEQIATDIYNNYEPGQIDLADVLSAEERLNYALTAYEDTAASTYAIMLAAEMGHTTTATDNLGYDYYPYDYADVNGAEFDAVGSAGASTTEDQDMGITNAAEVGSYTYWTSYGQSAIYYMTNDGGTPTVNSLSLSSAAYTVAYGGGDYLVAGQGSGNFSTIDVSDPANPTVANTGLTTSGINNSVSAAGDIDKTHFVLATQTSGEIAVVDISDPANPTQEYAWSGGDWDKYFSVEVDDNGIAHCAGNNNDSSTLYRIVDTTDGSSIETYTSGFYESGFSGDYKVRAEFTDPETQDTLAIQANDKISFIDVSDPTAANEIGNITNSNTDLKTAAVSGAGDFVFATNGKVWDISDPTAPEQTKTKSAPSGAWLTLVNDSLAEVWSVGTSAQKLWDYVTESYVKTDSKGNPKYKESTTYTGTMFFIERPSESDVLEVGGELTTGDIFLANNSLSGYDNEDRELAKPAYLVVTDENGNADTITLDGKVKITSIKTSGGKEVDNIGYNENEMTTKGTDDLSKQIDELQDLREKINKMEENDGGGGGGGDGGFMTDLLIIVAAIFGGKFALDFLEDVA